MRETGRDKDDVDKDEAAGATVGIGDTNDCGILSGGIACGAQDGK